MEQSKSDNTTTNFFISDFPQGLKPKNIDASCGTTEVVPCYKA
jgi:hypothetical protein